MDKKTYDLLGLRADPTEYGLKHIPYIRPSRYYLGTSASRSFRRCLRKWGFQSSYKLGLQGKGTEQNINFWFGSAIHFAMEDYFGWNRFGDPRRAFKAYYDAFDSAERPNDAEVHYDLGLGMLTYFLEWYPKHNANMQFETLWLKKQDNVEQPYLIAAPFEDGAFPAVEFELALDTGMRILVDNHTGTILARVDDIGQGQYEITNIRSQLQEYIEFKHLEAEPGCSLLQQLVGTFDIEKVLFEEGYDQKVYKCSYADGDTFIFSGELKDFAFRVQPIIWHGTVDKIVKDHCGRLWITDYKTAASADTNKLDTDDQISRYLWAAEQILQMPIYGFCYLQLTKAVPKQPKILANGSLSSDKRQKTTRSLYKQAIIDIYGSVEKAPANVINCLNVLAEKETPEGDSFIRWDLVTRTTEEKRSTFYNIIAEAKTMTSIELYCYPSPTRDCIWDCPFRSACLALDREDMQEFALSLDNYEVRDAERSDEEPGFYKRIKWPESVPVGVPSAEELNMTFETLNIIMPQQDENEGVDVNGNY